MDFDTAISYSKYHNNTASWWINGWNWWGSVVCAGVGVFGMFISAWAIVMIIPFLVSLSMAMYHAKKGIDYLSKVQSEKD